MNFLSLLINVSISALNLLFLLFLFGGQQFNIVMIILIPMGGLFVGIGTWLGWSMKQIWIMEDPNRSLAFQAFDYFDIFHSFEEVEEAEEGLEDALAEESIEGDSSEN